MTRNEVGKSGLCRGEIRFEVRDTTGAGDSFCAGVVSGLTYGCDLSESVEIGTRLAASVVTSSEKSSARDFCRQSSADSG